MALGKLVELDAVKYGPVCFILGAMLERKRILKVREEIHDGEARGFVYEHAKTGDVFSIWDPNLKLDELEGIQRDVADLLESGVEAFLQDRDPNGAGQSVQDAGENAEEGGDLGDADEVADETESSAEASAESMSPEESADPVVDLVVDTDSAVSK